MPQELPGTSGAAPVGRDAAERQYKSSRRKAASVRRTDGNVADILDRRNESRRYAQINYWDMWEDVYRALKCRTKPIMVTDKSGNQVEDTTRTNVAMPELSLIIRRKTARLTANPPQINFTTSEDGERFLSERLTAWNYMQFDRSGEALEHRKLVQSAQTFGYGVMKQYWDTVEITRQFYRSFVKNGQPYSVNRRGLMSLQGAPDDEISGAVKESGEELSPKEIQAALAKYGPTAQVPVRARQFEGPVSKNIFIGDFFLEPGAANLNVSGWAIENYFEGDVWLEKMANEVYIDPESGEERQVFDPKAIAELEDMPSWQPIYQQQPFDLRSRLRTNALGQTLPLWPTKLLKGKRYDILECHTKDKDGKFWIEYVGNEKVLLGKKPYAVDLYGKYAYTELVPMFDLLSAYGDSTPLLLRFLWLLHNSIVGGRRDLAANLLRPLMKMKAGADVPDEQIDRVLFRVVQMRNPADIEPLLDPINAAPAIQAATEEEAQNLRMMALAEPNLTNVETGTDSNPQAGKTATTAVLAAKSADALTQFELDSLNWYLKEANEKKLAMLQQIEPDQDGDSDSGYKPYQIPSQYTSKVEGITQRYGKAHVASLDFMEIQQEIQVEPAAMSMLSVDDDIRRTGTLQLVEMAGQMPNVIDPFYAARAYVSTIRGVDVDKAVKQPQPPAPPPPKVAITIAVKWPELPAEVQMQMLQAAGGQITPGVEQELQIHDTLKGIEKLSSAANHADNLMSTHGADEEAQAQAEKNTPMTKGVNNPSPTPTR
ncbi:MAG: hypothetical protein JO356_01145 [Acidobacteria bacterium]|nr:hypothetical protein [Acidobacteriota bacterium]